ncbi:MAG: hypothetical protein NC827_03680 [Candidatus Omnitrophica bacterium]|nr:hypothetical protein [Candidatus Omnitrophota bacterium]MCM8802394.1 hypothetical protein [Candidatus Omnitrophota bacterium]
MKKKIYYLVILFLSGWVFSGIEYLIFKNEKEKLNKKLEEREIEIKTYRNMLEEVEKSQKDIDNIINNLNDLKSKLKTIEEKIKRGDKDGNKSSQNSQ